jgi:hypothetical protein
MDWCCVSITFLHRLLCARRLKQKHLLLTPPLPCTLQDARLKGMDRLVLLTTRTADWFMQRDFRLAGPAWCSELLPSARRERINPARNSQLYVKELVPLNEKNRQKPGTRIGF